MTVPLELLPRGSSRPDLTEDLVAAEASVADVLAHWSAPAPVPVEAGVERWIEGTDRFVDLPLPGLDAVGEVLATGAPALVDVAPGLTGPGSAEDHVVDLLAVASHSGVGFGAGLVPRVDDAGQVWALLAGAVAAMTGGDVRAALRAPDPPALLGLPRSAREAVRDVVTCVVAPAGRVDGVVADLAGAHRPGDAD